ncbi:hypothetical protein ACLOJK_002681 [Asimina triloba]
MRRLGAILFFTHSPLSLSRAGAVAGQWRVVAYPPGHLLGGAKKQVPAAAVYDSQIRRAGQERHRCVLNLGLMSFWGESRHVMEAFVEELFLEEVDSGASGHPAADGEDEGGDEPVPWLGDGHELEEGFGGQSQKNLDQQIRREINMLSSSPTIHIIISSRWKTDEKICHRNQYSCSSSLLEP